MNIKPGMLFGRLTVIERAMVGHYPSYDVWRMQCSCGTVFEVQAKEMAKINSIKMCRGCAIAKQDFVYSRISEKVLRRRKMLKEKKKFYETGMHLKKPKPVFDK